MRIPDSYGISSPTLLVNAKPSNEDWADIKRGEQDIYVYEILRAKDGSLTAFAHYVPWVQADSGVWTPKAGQQSKYISGRVGKVKGGELLEIAVSAAALMPLDFKKGEKLGLNIVLKRDNSVLSLAPVKNYRNAEEPGDFNLVLSFIK